MSTSFATAPARSCGIRTLTRRASHAALFGNLTAMASTIYGGVADTHEWALDTGASVGSSDAQ